MKHIIIIICFALFLSGCRIEETEEYILEEAISFTLKNETFVCIKDYNNLNYTVLGITREDFEKLECYRQIDWINGVCFPDNCNISNPPVCTSTHMVYCYDGFSFENEYFDNIFINKSEE